MRIAPLAFCTDPRTTESRQVIRDVCRITHHNDEAYVGALAMVLAIRGAFEESQTMEAPSLTAIASSLPDTSIRDRMVEYAKLPRKVSLADVAARFGASGHVVESVPFAIYAAGRIGEMGFSTLLEQTVAVGGDTDTNASLAGQIAGTKLGFAGLPPDWIAGLPQAEMVTEIARKFANRLASNLAGSAPVPPLRRSKLVPASTDQPVGT